MGMGKGKIPHGFLHDPGAEAVQHAHPQPLEFTAVDPANLPHNAVQRLYLFFGLLIEISPGRRNGELPPMPLDQRHLKFTFQRFDLLRNSGLGDVAGLPRFKKAACFNNGDKVTHVPMHGFLLTFSNGK